MESTTSAPARGPRLDPHARDAAIDRALADIDVRLRHQNRITLRAGEATEIPSSRVTLVYIIEGGVTVGAPGSGASHASAGAPPVPAGATSDFRAGDALMFTGGAPHSLRVAEHAFVLLSALDFAPESHHVLGLLPDLLSVRDLAGSEPAVAALASLLGPELGSDQTPCETQAGSPVVCGMMANTVLVSVIRAWVLHGCAPDGWPSRTNDPFLDRVVEAIHADPARAWTIEDLARTGAMSRSVFAARFRSATGTSPASYLAEVRIRSAQNLLARGLGVSEVSRAIGYGSDEGFSRAFRRHVGLSPSTWRTTALRAAAA